jgi:hypothetical protein
MLAGHEGLVMLQRMTAQNKLRAELSKQGG